MQLNLTSFEKSISPKDRIDDTIASGITFKGLENVSNLQEILNDILCNYELEEGVFKLINEYCLSCKTKLKRMAKYYPKVKIVLIGSSEYRNLCKKVGKLCKFI